MKFKIILFIIADSRILLNESDVRLRIIKAIKEHYSFGRAKKEN